MTSKKQVNVDATDVNNTCLPVRICNNNCLSHHHNRHMHFTISILLLLWIRVRMRWWEADGTPMSMAERGKNILWMNFGYEYCTSVWCVCSDAVQLWKLLRVCLMFDMVLQCACGYMRWAVPYVYLNVYPCDFFNYISRASVYTRCFGVGNRFSTRPGRRKFYTWINSPTRQCKLIFINMSEILFASSTERAHYHVFVWVCSCGCVCLDA